MRVRTRYLLAFTLIVTALCADRAALAAPRIEATPARGLAERLTDSLRRTVATRPVVRQRCFGAATAVVTPPALPARPAFVAEPPACPPYLPQPPPAL